MSDTEKSARRHARWQKKLLPFMIVILSLVTGFFLVMTTIQLYYLHERIGDSPVLEVEKRLEKIDKKTPLMAKTDPFQLARWVSLVELEGNVMEKRYHQANVLLMSRIWTRYLGFVTGMILAIIGAIFILGKIRGTETSLEAKSEVGEFTFKSTSPGLIMTALGTILMVTTLVIKDKIEVGDGNLYLRNWYADVLLRSPVQDWAKKAAALDALRGTKRVEKPPSGSETDDEILNGIPDPVEAVDPFRRDQAQKKAE